MSDQIKYTRLTDSTVAAIGHQGETPETLEIPAQMRHAGKTFSVTQIGIGAFSGSNGLSKVSMYEAKIEVIGAKAFAGCEKLKEVILPESLREVKEHSFAWCGISQLALFEKVERLGEYAFVGCSSLKMVSCDATTPPEISDKTFDAETLEKGQLVVHESVLDDYRKADGWKKFRNIITIENMVKELAASSKFDEDDDDDEDEDENTYDKKDLIYTDTIIYRITEDGEASVRQCNPENRGTLEIANTVKKDGKTYAVTSIDQGALNGQKVTTIALPENIADVTPFTFVGCENLTYIKVDPRNEQLGDTDGVLTDKYRTVLLCYPRGRQATHYSIPPTIEGIATSSFACCDALREVYCFDSLRHFGSQCFYRCTNLKRLTLPQSASDIYGGAFYQCDNLEDIYVQSEISPILNDGFSEATLNNATLHVPKESLQVYKEDNDWGKFKKIRALTFISQADDGKLMFRQNGHNTCTLIATDKEAAEHTVVPRTVEWEGMTYTVDRIGRECLSNNISIISISIADTIRSIGYQAFSGCTKLEKLTLPASVEMIENEAFMGCSNLRVVELGRNIEAIGDGIVNGCSNLLEIKVAEDNQHYTSRNGILYDRRGALVAYPAAKEDLTLTIEASVDAMNGTTFMDATNLLNFEVAPGNRNYASHDGVLVSHDQKKLIAYPRGRQETEYTVYGTIESISQWAFGRSQLEEIHLPASLTHLAAGAFYNCKKLKRIALPEGLTTLSDRSFLCCSELTEIALPKSLEKIEMGAFGSCIKLEQIELPEKVTVIESNAFINCIRLWELHLPAKLETIGNKAFNNCIELTHLVLPASLTLIGHAAFRGAFGELGLQNSKLDKTKTMTIEMEGTTPPAIGDDAFDEYSYQKVKLIVPKEAVRIYKQSPVWSRFRTIISKEDVLTWKENTFTVSDIEYKQIGPSQLEVIRAKKRVYLHLELPEAIEINGKPYTITRIGESAFEETDVFMLDIQAPVESIGNYAFCNSTVWAIGLPNTLTEIGIGAFGGCKELRHINLPNSLTELGIEAFAQCYKLEAVALPNHLERIGYRTFYNCQELKAVTLPDALEIIEERAFENCETLTSISFSDELEEIGKAAFKNCRFLQLVRLPDNVTEIGEEAFAGNSSLISIGLPASIIEIGKDAFRQCEMLQKITVRKGNAYYSSHKGILYNADMSELICCPPMLTDLNNNGKLELPNTVRHLYDGAFEYQKAKEIVLNEEVETIGDRCFAHSKISSINLPAQLKSIGKQAFMSCSRLEKIKIPAKVTHLREELFRNCKKLKDAALPPGIKEIEPGAFKGCSSLTALTIEGEDCIVRKHSFDGCKNLGTVNMSGIKTIEEDAFSNCGKTNNK